MHRVCFLWLLKTCKFKSCLKCKIFLQKKGLAQSLFCQGQEPPWWINPFGPDGMLRSWLNLKFYYSCYDIHQDLSYWGEDPWNSDVIHFKCCIISTNCSQVVTCDDSEHYRFCSRWWLIWVHCHKIFGWLRFFYWFSKDSIVF